MTACLNDQAPTVFGDGEQSRDFTFVDNVVDANMLALEARGDVAGKVYNIACGERVSLNELLDQVRELTGSGVGADHRAERAGDVRHSLADISRARAELGYEPQVDLREGLRRTLEVFELPPTPAAAGSPRRAAPSAVPSARVRVVRVIARLNAGGPAHHVGLLSSRLGDRYETLLVHGRVGPGEAPLAEFDVRYPTQRRELADLGRDIRPLRDLRTFAQLVRLMRRAGPISCTPTPPRQGCSAAWPHSSSGRGRSSSTPTTATSSRATSDGS